jgi:hypothetical protein
MITTTSVEDSDNYTITTTSVEDSDNCNYHFSKRFRKLYDYHFISRFRYTITTTSVEDSDIYMITALK